MSAVILSFSKNLASFLFYDKNTKRFEVKTRIFTFRTLQIQIGRSKTKTADLTSGGYCQVSVVKISARSEKVKGGSKQPGLRKLVFYATLKKREESYYNYYGKKIS